MKRFNNYLGSKIRCGESSRTPKASISDVASVLYDLLDLMDYLEALKREDLIGQENYNQVKMAISKHMKETVQHN